jgi:hypothetical protein
MSTRRRITVAAVTVASAAITMLGIGGGALASNAPATNQIKACFKNGVTLPPLDHIAPTGTCPTGDSSLVWNKVGPPGPQGPAGISTGVSGTSGTSVPLNTAQSLVTVFSSAAAPVSGTYYVSASVMLIVAQGDTVACILADNNGAQGAFATVGPVPNQTYETIPLSQAISVAAGDSVRVECTGYTANTNTSFYDGGITATLINSASGNGPRISPAQHPALPKHL